MKVTEVIGAFYFLKNFFKNFLISVNATISFLCHAWLQPQYFYTPPPPFYKGPSPPRGGLTFIPVSVRTEAAASAFCTSRILAVRSITLYCPAAESTASLARACCTGEVSSYPNLINSVGFPCDEVKAFIFPLWCEIRKPERYFQSIHHERLLENIPLVKLIRSYNIVLPLENKIYIFSPQRDIFSIW